MAALVGAGLAMFLHQRSNPDAAVPGVHESATKSQGINRHDTAKGPARALNVAQSPVQPVMRRHVVSHKQAHGHDTGPDAVGASTESSAAVRNDLDECERRFLNEPNDAQWAAAVAEALMKTTSASPFAQQISQTEAVRSNDFFADVVRTLAVYGAAVIRPEAIATATWA